MAAAQGRVERLLRPEALHVLRRIELGKMAAENFFRLVTFDALGSRIPRRHVALRIEQINRVVLNAFDQQPEPLLAQTEAVFQLLLSVDSGLPVLIRRGHC